MEDTSHSSPLQVGSYRSNMYGLGSGPALTVLSCFLALLPLAGPQQFSSSTHDSRLEMCIKGNVCTQVGLLIKTFQVLYVCMYIYNKPFINWMWIIQLKNNTNIPITYASKKCFYRWMCMHSWRTRTFWQTQPSTTAAIKSIPKLHTMELWPSTELVEPSRNTPKPESKAKPWKHTKSIQISRLKNSFESFRKERLTHVAHGTKMCTGSSSYAMIVTLPLAKCLASKCAVQMMPVNSGRGTKYVKNILSPPEQHLMNHCTQDFARNCCSSTSSPSFQGGNQHGNLGSLYVLQWNESLD